MRSLELLSSQVTVLTRQILFYIYGHAPCKVFAVLNPPKPGKGLIG